MTLLRTLALPLATLSLLVTQLDAQRPAHITQAFVDTLELHGLLPTTGTQGGVSVDPDGNLYVSNFSSALRKITPDGQVSLLNMNFFAASGNSFAPDGRLFQSDFARNRIYTVDTNTGQRTLIVRNGLNGPVGVAVDDSGAVFIANCNGQNIKRAAPGGINAITFASSPLFSCPNGILIAPDGDLFVSNFFSDDLLRVDSDGNVSVHAVVGTSGLGGGHLTRIGTNLYVTRFHSHDLFRVSLTGATERIVGTETVPGIRDGRGRFARLRHPNGIAASADGRFLYLNNLIGPQGTGMPGRMVIRRVHLP